MGNLSKYLFLLILAFIIFSCQNRPNEVLTRKKMENVMYDMYIAEGIIEHDHQNFSLPEQKEALINQVLKKHKISETQWDTSLSWYSDNIDQYIQLNDSVKSRLQHKQKIAQQLSLRQAAILKELEQKPANYIPAKFFIAGLGCDRGFKFSFDSIQLSERFNDKDTILFKYKIIGVSPHDSYSLKSMLLIKYADTTVHQVAKLEENKSYSFPVLKHLKQDTIVSLDGFINLSGKLPTIPIQLYQISLGDVNNDSTLLVKNLNKKKQLEQPKKVRD